MKCLTYGEIKITIMKKRFFFKLDNGLIRTLTFFFFLLLLGSFNNLLLGQTGTWTAPASAEKLKNPLQGIEKATMAGKTLYKQYCEICHGKKGRGDGVAGMALKPRPANLAKDIIQKQSDGAIYWKMTEGKAPMASYKEALTEEQRWQLVNFIRSLKK
jgi:mono/diheme cytochrome c family protein